MERKWTKYGVIEHGVVAENEDTTLSTPFLPVELAYVEPAMQAAVIEASSTEI